MREKKNLLNYCGLLGIAAFLSYTAAVVFSAFASGDLSVYYYGMGVGYGASR